jgi:hypothetical protein
LCQRAGEIEKAIAFCQVGNAIKRTNPDLLTTATFEIEIPDEKIQDVVRGGRGLAILLEPALNQLLQAETGRFRSRRLTVIWIAVQAALSAGRRCRRD